MVGANRVGNTARVRGDERKGKDGREGNRMEDEGHGRKARTE